MDGSGVDLCTSGGAVSFRDPDTGERFRILFKLVGAPNGTINWNARKFVSPRNDEKTWQQTLVAIHERLRPDDLAWDARNVRVNDHTIETYDSADPSDVLMSGQRHEMVRLLAFRRAFEDVYAVGDSQNVKLVVWMLIDSLLNSATQQDMSRRWVEHLRSPDVCS